MIVCLFVSFSLLFSPSFSPYYTCVCLYDVRLCDFWLLFIGNLHKNILSLFVVCLYAWSLFTHDSFFFSFDFICSFLFFSTKFQIVSVVLFSMPFFSWSCRHVRYIVRVLLFFRNRLLALFWFWHMATVHSFTYTYTHAHMHTHTYTHTHKFTHSIPYHTFTRILSILSIRM